ncbi:hypothetical protein LCGC14_0386130 [marine sediment metagenome]|uniref:Uncharacterized protein n=1 Tax=marine sediment metagenome TaxID=412755 RepID=A0A0F9T6P8_9ZZZZ
MPSMNASQKALVKDMRRDARDTIAYCDRKIAELQERRDKAQETLDTFLVGFGPEPKPEPIEE